ncbi:MAG: DUF1667 domain-containing protein [Eubacteriaceae bacterium]|nr:DUF1667 domain-containing protein [Eubacteriaceae bacterium]
MEASKKYTCVVCPIGCSVNVQGKDGEYEISGNKCKRGSEYALNEMTDPRRVVTSTVLVKGGKEPVTSVKTTAAVSKYKIFDIMTMINNVTVQSPCKIGDVLIPNIDGAGTDLVVTRNC